MLDQLLPDIPRFYTATAEWFACFYLTFPLIKNKNMTLLLLMSYPIQILLQFFVRQWQLSLWMLGMILNVLWMFLIIHKTAQKDFYSSIYLCCKAFIMAEFTASISWQLFCHLILNRYENEQIIIFPFMFISYIIIFIIFYIIDNKINKVENSFIYSKKEVFSIILTAVVIFSVSNIGFILINTTYPIGNMSTIFIFRTLIYLFGLSIIYLQESHRYEKTLHKELSSIQNIIQQQYEQYIAFKNSSEVIQRQFHDLKHQITLIKTEKNSSKKEQYLEEMNNAINIYSAKINSGNPILDTILTSKNSYCIENNITFTCFVDGQLLDNFSAMDICSLFGNSIDNAIEATMKLSEEKRSINLKVIKKANFIIISIKNTSQQIDLPVNSLPSTTKKNREIHGYGLKSISIIIKKYNGIMKINKEGIWFSLKIMFPS